MRILVIEDHSDTLRWLQLHLEDLDHIVFTAGGLQEGLALLLAVPCDVLISDIGLPDGTAWELLDRCPLPHPILAISMSSYGSKADSLRSRAAGYQHHLVKPFKIAELEDLLGEAARACAARVKS